MEVAELEASDCSLICIVPLSFGSTDNVKQHFIHPVSKLLRFLVVRDFPAVGFPSRGVKQMLGGKRYADLSCDPLRTGACAK